jgi:stress response protein YsnF
MLYLNFTYTLVRTKDTGSEPQSERSDTENNSNISHPTIETISNKSDKSDDDSSNETVQIIPIIEENFNLTKKTIIHETKIIKRMAIKTEKIEVPIAYEEVYANNKKLRIYDKEEEGFLSKVKDTIVHRISTSDDDNIEYHYLPSSSEYSNGSSKPNQTTIQEYYDSSYNTKGEAVVLIEGQEKNETEKIVPIWGEEIIVRKRKVKLGEVVIRKRRIIESRRIDVDIKKEKVLVEYPDGRKEELKTSLQEENDIK